MCGGQICNNPVFLSGKRGYTQSQIGRARCRVFGLPGEGVDESCVQSKKLARGVPRKAGFAPPKGAECGRSGSG
jgi:hypothetical protein